MDLPHLIRYFINIISMLTSLLNVLIVSMLSRNSFLDNHIQLSIPSHHIKNLKGIFTSLLFVFPLLAKLYKNTQLTMTVVQKLCVNFNLDKCLQEIYANSLGRTFSCASSTDYVIGKKKNL